MLELTEVLRRLTPERLEEVWRRTWGVGGPHNQGPVNRAAPSRTVGASSSDLTACRSVVPRGAGLALSRLPEAVLGLQQTDGVVGLRPDHDLRWLRASGVRRRSQRIRSPGRERPTYLGGDDFEGTVGLSALSGQKAVELGVVLHVCAEVVHDLGPDRVRALGLGVDWHRVGAPRRPSLEVPSIRGRLHDDPTTAEGRINRRVYPLRPVVGRSDPTVGETTALKGSTFSHGGSLSWPSRPPSRTTRGRRTSAPRRGGCARSVRVSRRPARSCPPRRAWTKCSRATGKGQDGSTPGSGSRRRCFGTEFRSPDLRLCRGSTGLSSQPTIQLLVGRRRGKTRFCLPSFPLASES